MEALQSDQSERAGKIELVPLNCLDEQQFQEIIGHFPEGEVVIINEGLLIYLNQTEKENLCSLIHKILKQRGGYWITADIYIKGREKKFDLKIDSKTTEFFKQHHIEDNKFNSFEEAESFFSRMGFIIDKESDVKSSELSSIKYFLKSLTLKQLLKLRNGGKLQKTWRLRVADAISSTKSLV
jgi:O-methyltransferase involved in polyketide biosynthesis